MKSLVKIVGGLIDIQTVNLSNTSGVSLLDLVCCAQWEGKLAVFMLVFFVHNFYFFYFSFYTAHLFNRTMVLKCERDEFQIGKNPTCTCCLTHISSCSFFGRMKYIDILVFQNILY
jgi:hypothetical protein